MDQGLVAGLTFRHVLTHEVAYGTLLSSDRQARHSRVARMLEQLYRGRTEEVSDALAHHWLQSDSRLKALPHLLAAADRTVAMGANQEAIGHLQTALAVVGENPGAVGTAEIDAIRLKLAGLYFVVGER